MIPIARRLHELAVILSRSRPVKTSAFRQTTSQNRDKKIKALRRWVEQGLTKLQQLSGSEIDYLAERGVSRGDVLRWLQRLDGRLRRGPAAVQGVPVASGGRDPVVFSYAPPPAPTVDEILADGFAHRDRTAEGLTGVPDAPWQHRQSPSPPQPGEGGRPANAPAHLLAREALRAFVSATGYMPNQPTQQVVSFTRFLAELLRIYAVKGDAKSLSAAAETWWQEQRPAGTA